MNIASIDLNLLRIFDVMLTERSTVKTGEVVGLSQSAVSAALGRLRHIARDELFVRQGNAMVPTSRAESMAEPVREALARLEGAFDTVAPFAPDRSARVFRLLGSDYFSALLMPPLTRSVLQLAPQVTLQMLDMPSSEVVDALICDAVDVALSPATFDPPSYISKRTLYRSYVVAVARRGHPALADIEPGSRIPAERFCAIPQVIMSMDGSRTGTIDAPLAAQGLARSVALTLPHFQAVALTVADGELLGNLPVHYAELVATTLALDLYLPPHDPPVMDVDLYWHRRRDTDTANLWLRERIAEVFSANMLRTPADAALTAAMARV